MQARTPKRFMIRRVAGRALLPIAAGLIAGGAQAADEQPMEEMVVVGSQIKGAKISDALAVSIIGADDIEAMGIDSGDQLLDLIPENGQNFFNEAENISGGVNSARGDIGAFNLRNLGTGNTLVLLNGRRLVNAASYQTEEVGGSFVPVNTVNSQTLPVWGIKRVEILRDGASAIYGADAVAGVVNTVLKDDFEGFNVRFRWSEYENLPRNDQTLTLEWGKSFNEGRTNVAAFFNMYQRDRVNSGDDPRWQMGDHRDLLADDSPWKGNTAFRNTSANSLFGQFDIVDGVSSSNSLRQNDIVDNRGEFEVFPAGDARCTYEINEFICGDEDGNGTERYNLNENRDLASDLERISAFVNISHELSDNLESFTEILAYQSRTNLLRHPSAQFSTSELVVGAQNYYNPLGPCGSPNRLPDSVIGTDVPCEGLAMTLDNYRFAEAPRIVDNDGDVYRFLQGFRGDVGDWSWESALSYSKATKDDVTQNRVSNTLMQAALNDPTPAAYNPFSAGVDNNIERARISVVRESETELTTFDVKFSNPDLFALPAGPVAALVGFEWRDESFNDDRDPRLDGTIVFTDAEGDTFPFVSDVANSSPTPDNSGDRAVTSLFGELQVPVFETLDVQLALRYEDFDDISDSTTVGKMAFGWRPIEQLLVRGSWSEAYRVPNLVTVNEDIVARTNTGLTDFVCQYAEDNSSFNDLDCGQSMQRIAQGSNQLEPEESTNTSIGLVVEPLEGLMITLDYWTIEKEKTIGLFGQENHTLLDLLARLQAGTGNCAATFNPAVSRLDPDDDDRLAAYGEAGICPAGEVAFVSETYDNFDTRTVEGFDVGVYYDIDTDLGSFSVLYNGSFLDTYEQQAGGNAALLVAAQAAGTLPANYPVSGFADLIGADGNQDSKQRVRVSWRKDAFGAAVSGYRLGDFYQSGLTLADGTRYVVPAMTTYDATFDYRTAMMGADVRLRLGIKNLTDERAPLTDRYFGFSSDSHSDYGRYMYFDVKLGLN